MDQLDDEPKRLTTFTPTPEVREAMEAMLTPANLDTSFYDVRLGARVTAENRLSQDGDYDLSEVRATIGRARVVIRVVDGRLTLLLLGGAPTAAEIQGQIRCQALYNAPDERLSFVAGGVLLPETAAVLRVVAADRLSLTLSGDFLRSPHELKVHAEAADMLNSMLDGRAVLG